MFFSFNDLPADPYPLELPSEKTLEGRQDAVGACRLLSATPKRPADWRPVVTDHQRVAGVHPTQIL